MFKIQLIIAISLVNQIMNEKKLAMIHQLHIQVVMILLRFPKLFLQVYL